MAITDASRLANFASNVGTGVTFNGNDILVAGVVTATSFVGDGSDLTGVSGFATAISSTQGDFLNQVFVTAKVDPALVILEPSPTKLVAVTTPATNISLPAKVTPVPTLEAKLANLLASVIAIIPFLFSYLFICQVLLLVFDWVDL